MSYHRALVTRWSVRDRLAILVIAVTAAFLVGAVVVLLAISGQTTAMAQEHSAETAVSISGSPPTDDSTDTTLPLATATVDGSTRTVVGIPSEGALGVEPPDGVAGPLSTDGATLAGNESTVTLEGERRTGDAPFPDGWLLTNDTVASDLGADRSLAVHETTSPAPETGAPLSSALGFFLVGTRQLLALLGVVCIGVAVLVGVVVFSVSRMTVRDRRSTITVARATGAAARRIWLLIGVRAGVLTLAGVTLGYAIGVIVPNVAATLAVTLGYPVGLPLAVDARAATLVAGVLLTLVAVGTLAGVLAAQGAVRGAPLDGTTTTSSEWPGGPSFLSGGAVLPTTATLTVFVAFALVVIALTGVVGGVGATGGQGGGIVVESGAVHPVDSEVPEAYAGQLRDAGAPASPEILLFLVHDGQAVPTRGASFDAYRSVTDARIADGRSPNATDEAVVGTDLATTLSLEPGDELALGGSTTRAVGVVEVVGTFEAGGVADDHLLVSLPLARHLEDVPPGRVNVVRYDRTPAGGSNDSVVATGLHAPQRVTQGETIPVDVRVRNVGTERSGRTITARFGDRTRTHRVELGAGERRTVEFTFEATDPGSQTVRIAGRAWRQEVSSPDALTTSPLPGRGPPNASLRVAVGTNGGSTVDAATVSIGDRSASTDADGVTRVRLPSTPGRYQLRVTAGNRSLSREISVATGASREPAIRLVAPNRTSVFHAPTAEVRIANPWDSGIKGTVSLAGPGVDVSRSIQLESGADHTLSRTLDRRPPGEYAVRASVGDREVTSQYVVTGDERLASAIASSGTVAGGTDGLVSRAFGNVWLVLATLVALGALMTVGTTVATFADAVQAKRSDVGVHRAVGAGPGRIARLVLGDALRIAIPAVVASVVLAVLTLHGLAGVGLLTVFGVQVSPNAPLAVVGPLAVVALGLALAGAGLVAVRYGSIDPSRLLGGGE